MPADAWIMDGYLVQFLRGSHQCSARGSSPGSSRDHMHALWTIEWRPRRLVWPGRLLATAVGEGASRTSGGSKIYPLYSRRVTVIDLVVLNCSSPAP